MINRFTGKLIEKSPPQVIIDANGVGYEANVSMQTSYNLPPVGKTVHLHTQLVIREDAHSLFGPALVEEHTIFRQLVKVSSIGAKTALGILSATNADELVQAVAEEDVKCLSSVPGIGKKTAECMVLELRGKLIPYTVSDGLFAPDAVVDKSQDIIDALFALGYSEHEAKTAIKGIPKGTEVGEGVRLALKNLLK